MKNILTKALSVLLIFLMVSSFSFVYAIEIDNTDFNEGDEWIGTGSNASDDYWSEIGSGIDESSSENDDSLNGASGIELDRKKIEELQKNVGIFQQVMTEIALTVGDYAQDYLSKVFREDLTIDRIVFNDSEMLNANFFDNSKNHANSQASETVKEFINKWFSYFRKLALVVIISYLVVAGIKIMFGTANDKAGAYESLKKIVIAVMLVYFFPYVLRLSFDLNDALVAKIKDYAYSGINQSLGATISQVSDLEQEELEFRSPIYIASHNARITAGSKEATELYLSKIQQYAATADMMRILRALTGITLRFVYAIIWYIMLIQLYMLVIIYLKRYFTIAFLLIIYPLVVVGYVSGNMFGNSSATFNSWCKKFFSTVFLQCIHAVIYGVISGIVINQIRPMVVNGEVKTLNWLLMIIATSFLMSGEKILMRLFNSSIDTSERGGARALLGAPGKIKKALFGK